MTNKTTCLLVLSVLCIVAACVLPIEFSAAAFVLLGATFSLKDEELAITLALPNGIATVASDGFDLGHGTNGDFLANCELLIEAPALVVGDLANGDTVIYDVYHDTDSAFGSETLLMDNVITQTGAGGAGAAAATAQVRLPVDVKRYVRVKASNSGAGDASDKSATIRLVF